MGKNRLLVDSDIFIGYLNRRQHREYLEGAQWQIYYSVVTKKELLAKQGLSDRERTAILFLLRRYRQVTLTQAIAGRYAELRRLYPALEREAPSFSWAPWLPSPGGWAPGPSIALWKGVRRW